jgi:hypothetical protein
MSAPEQNDDLENFLAQRSLLPPALQAREQSEPPAELDRQILQNARAAIEPGAARKMLLRNRWFVPLTLAATVVLSFTIVIRIQQSGDSPYAPMSGRVIEPATVSESANVPLQKTEQAQLRPIPERVMRREISVPELDAADTTVAAETSRATAPLSDEIAGLAKEAPAVAAAAPATPPAPVLESRRTSEVAESKAYVASRERTVPAQASAAANDEVQSDAATAEPQPASAGREGAAVARIAMEPKVWLQRILKLRAEGKTAQADREWQAFRKRYPDYVIDRATSEGLASDSVAK